MRLPMQATASFATKQVIRDPQKNKYQEAQMLFFTQKDENSKKNLNSRPKTIQEIKKI